MTNKTYEDGYLAGLETARTQSQESLDLLINNARKKHGDKSEAPQEAVHTPDIIKALYGE